MVRFSRKIILLLGKKKILRTKIHDCGLDEYLFFHAHKKRHNCDK